MYVTAAKVKQLDYYTPLNRDFRSDLHWWNTFLTCGIQRYLQFCNLINHPPLHTSEQTLLLFTSYLALQHLSSSTIQTYLVAVHHLHLSTNHLTEYNTQFTPSVQQVLCGIKQQQASVSPPPCRLPITTDIMH